APPRSLSRLFRNGASAPQCDCLGFTLERFAGYVGGFRVRSGPLGAERRRLPLLAVERWEHRRPDGRVPRSSAGLAGPIFWGEVPEGGRSPSPSWIVKAPTPLEALLKDRVSLAVGSELRAVEEAIATQISSPVPLIQEMGEFIAGAGGKRLRPILLLMAARL